MFRLDKSLFKLRISLLRHIWRQFSSSNIFQLNFSKDFLLEIKIKMGVTILCLHTWSLIYAKKNLCWFIVTNGNTLAICCISFVVVLGQYKLLSFQNPLPYLWEQASCRVRSLYQVFGGLYFCKFSSEIIPKATTL